mmetsp:Transcript_5778/g.6529  ORF Transcript_5778/g.6529 Transcript_5778/m.6529 type:complete len:80 (+) Transcript_5778:648-887(+)
MAASQGVRATESHDVSIVEAHAKEDVAQVIGPLRSIRQPTHHRTRVSARCIVAAKVEGNRRASEELDGQTARENPQIGQ